MLSQLALHSSFTPGVIRTLILVLVQLILVSLYILPQPDMTGGITPDPAQLAALVAYVSRAYQNVV